jgi:hypothetical protein
MPPERYSSCAGAANFAGLCVAGARSKPPVAGSEKGSDFLSLEIAKATLKTKLRTY